MTKPKDVIILYLTLALIAGVFYHTVFKIKRNEKTKKEITLEIKE